MAELRGLLVDYGGVLTNPLPEIMGSWLRREGIAPAHFADLMQRWLVTGADRNPVHDLETGTLGPEEFERRLAAELSDRTGGRAAGRADPIRTAGLLARMFADMRAAPDMVDVVRRARADGVRTGLLSNSWGMDYSRDGWEALFDAVVISGEVGLRKPDPRIYLLAAERLDLPPAQIVFVDDLRPNVLGAAAVGMVGVLHADVRTTLEELTVLFGRSWSGSA